MAGAAIGVGSDGSFAGPGRASAGTSRPITSTRGGSNRGGGSKFTGAVDRVGTIFGANMDGGGNTVLMLTGTSTVGFATTIGGGNFVVVTGISAVGFATRIGGGNIVVLVETGTSLTGFATMIGGGRCVGAVVGDGAVVDGIREGGSRLGGAPMGGGGKIGGGNIGGAVVTAAGTTRFIGGTIGVVEGDWASPTPIAPMMPAKPNPYGRHRLRRVAPSRIAPSPWCVCGLFPWAGS